MRHLNDEDKRYILDCYNVGIPPRPVAEKLGCSMRAVQKHYQLYRGYPMPQKEKKSLERITTVTLPKLKCLSEPESV